MAYPTLEQNLDSREQSLDGRQIDRASNGAVKARVLFGELKRQFTVVHENLSNTDKGSVESFYTTNRLLSFDFVWAADGISRVCIFNETPPVYVPLAGGCWNVTVQLVQV